MGAEELVRAQVGCCQCLWAGWVMSIVVDLHLTEAPDLALQLDRGPYVNGPV